MSAPELLKQLDSLGVDARAQGDKLVLRGKTYCLTEEMIETLRNHKAALMAHLRLLAPFTDILTAARCGDVPRGLFPLLSTEERRVDVTDFATFVSYSARMFGTTRQIQYRNDLALAQAAWRRWKAGRR
jgi:hypothetical protein